MRAIEKRTAENVLDFPKHASPGPFSERSVDADEAPLKPHGPTERSGVRRRKRLPVHDWVLAP